MVFSARYFRNTSDMDFMTDTLDPDIARMTLSEGEKWGMQVYRNYSREFGNYRVKTFVEQAPSFEADVNLFEQISSLVVSEELRAIPVFTSSYVDDRLFEMFKREIPDGVPGGRSALMSGFGPLARLSQRLQMAFAFSWLSKDLIVELDHIRKIRNDLSHNWDIALLERRLNEFIEKKLRPIEESLGDGVRLPKDFYKSMSHSDRFRVRIIWMLGRLTYEARLWVPALKAGIGPTEALYGPYQSGMLRSISALCLDKTKVIVGD